MAGVTDAALNADEIQYLRNVVFTEKTQGDGVTKLAQTESPVYNILMSKAQRSDQPANGGFRVHVSGNRNQKITWWDGNDILPFHSEETTMKMNYRIGRGHYGAEFMLDLFARQGINVDYSRGIRKGGGDSRRKAAEVAINVIKDHWDDIEYNYTDEMRKTVWNDNTSQPKAFTGIRGLLTPSTTYSGTIGGLPRSNPLLQHHVMSGVTMDTVELGFSQMLRRIRRRARAKMSDYVIAAGDNFYDMLVDLYVGTSTRAGKFDYRARQEAAKAMGEKLNIGLPPNSFVTDEGVLVVNDPTFEELQNEFGPATSWLDLCWFLCTKYLRIVPVMEQTIDHGVPYNQKVSHTSFHGELAVVLDHPASCGIMML